MYFHIHKEQRLNVEKDWTERDFKDLKLIKITGGEPMLHPDFYKFLSKMKQDQIECDIFTNASHVPKPKLLNNLLKFKNLQIFLSIDDLGSKQEYLRHNADWETTEKSAIKWLQFMKENKDKVGISWAPTFSMLNAESLPAIGNWWLNLLEEHVGELGSKTSVVPSNILNYPPYMTLKLHKRLDQVKKQNEEYLD